MRLHVGAALATAMAIGCCALSAADAQQTAPRFHIRGKVVDITGAPIQGAEVSISVIANVATLRDGRFDLGEFVPGEYTVAVRHIGFYPITKDVELTNRDIGVGITLRAVPTVLDTVRTSAMEAQLPRLFDRMSIHLGRVSFGSDLRDRYPNAPVSDYLKDDKGMHMMLGPGGCGAFIYIDGRLLPRGFTIDEMVRPREVSAIEAFESPDFIGEMFIPRPIGWRPDDDIPGECSRIILIWTKYYKMRPHPAPSSKARSHD